jgi:hypothetical protein
MKSGQAWRFRVQSPSIWSCAERGLRVRRLKRKARGAKGAVVVSDEFDVDSHFPMHETFEDFAGQERNFIIDCYFNGIGFTVRAREQGHGFSGYEFGVYSETSWTNALGRLRHEVQRELATRYLSSKGSYQLLHDTMKGRIGSDGEGAVTVVVDGIELGLSEFGKILSTYEGWEFELKIIGSLE